MKKLNVKQYVIPFYPYYLDGFRMFFQIDLLHGAAPAVLLSFNPLKCSSRPELNSPNPKTVGGPKQDTGVHTSSEAIK
jgi:hypothetical protein